MASTAEKVQGELGSIRDTVESIWVAIVLAFVLRAFLIEAFVIPTGSMAPRLLGEHWDLACPSCGYEYAFGGPRDRGSPGPLIDRSREYVPADAHCPNCGALCDSLGRYLNGGDRVLVLKYLYRFSEPRPWDVVVFRNPQDNRENYIKRLIGLPGETIEIVHGDIFVGQSPEGPRTIRRKPPAAQEAMWQVVYDNDYRPDPRRIRAGSSPQWVVASGGEDWDLDGLQGRRMTYKGGQGVGELAFKAPAGAFLPHYGYNSLGAEAINPSTDICSDLRLSLLFVPRDPLAKVALSLSALEHRFRGEFGADGTVRLLYQSKDRPDDPWQLWSERKLDRSMTSGRGYEVAITHVDFSVGLWVDGRVVLEITDRYPETYDSLRLRLADVMHRPIPTPEIGISAWGAASDLLHVKLYRDVYYTVTGKDSVKPGPLGELARRTGVVDKTPGWGTMGHSIHLAKYPQDPDIDEFFMLGDNSPQSLDGRGWTSAAPTLRLYGDSGELIYQLGTVPRYNLIGKAFFVYWPAGFRLPGLPGLPIVPNVGKLRPIR